MTKQPEIEFKTLLSEREYLMLIEKFDGAKYNDQTNHYFDTPRFTIKAMDASLRVRERDGEFEITLKKKKRYARVEYTVKISKEEFEEMKKTGICTNPEIAEELAALIDGQKIENFMSLFTHRVYLPYSNGVLFIDRSEYCGQVDYEMEYEAKSYHLGKEEFIALIREFKIEYKKSDKKINRAFNAYKRLYQD